MIVTTNRSSHANSVTKLFVVITLCTFHLTVLARVVTPEYSKPDAGVQNESIPQEPNYVTGSRVIAPTTPVLKNLSNYDDSPRQPIEKRADGDELTWEDAHRTGRKILKEFDKRRESGSPGYTRLPGGSDEAKDVLKNDYEVEQRDSEHDMSESHIINSLNKDGITTKKGDWVFLHIKEKGKETYFKNSYVYDRQERAGVIVAENVMRKPDGKLQWSEVAFQQYSQEFSDSALADLKYIYRSNIVNYRTSTFMEDAIDRDRQSLDTVQTADDEIWWVFRRKSQPESFTGLLGSENGRGAGYLVNDHMEELGKNRGITEIHVSLDAMSMKMVLGPVC